jgi:hypothetical protein
LPDGSVTVTRDKSTDMAHFCVNSIHVFNPNGPVVTRPQSQIVSSYTVFVPQPPQPVNGATGVAGASNIQRESVYNGNEKEQSMQGGPSGAFSSAEAAAAETPAHVDTPPNYSNLFPTLPPN